MYQFLTQASKSSQLQPKPSFLLCVCHGTPLLLHLASVRLRTIYASPVPASCFAPTAFCPHLNLPVIFSHSTRPLPNTGLAYRRAHLKYDLLHKNFPGPPSLRHHLPLLKSYRTLGLICVICYIQGYAIVLCFATISPIHIHTWSSTMSSLESKSGS